MNEVKTDFSHDLEESLSATSAAVIKGCTDNKDPIIVTLLAIVVTTTNDYNSSLALCVHGDEAETVLKNKHKGLMLLALKNLGKQVNISNAGDRTKALDSGFPLVKTPGHQLMGEVENFKVTPNTVAGKMDLQVKKPETFATHGTVFAYWDVALGPTPTDKSKWFHRQSNGHHLSIAGFTPGTNYPFAAAYKGLDDEALIWSDIITKMAGD